MTLQHPLAPTVLVCRQLQQKNPNHAAQFAEIMARLEASNLSRGANLEKLNRGTTEQTLYSVRLSYKSRLLLSRLWLGDTCHWLLLDELENHDYDRSPFLNKNHLKNFLAQEQASLAPTHTPPSELGSNSSSSSSKPAQNTSPIVLEYFNQQLIELNPEQSEAVHAKLPLIVSGMPGSGKSCVAASMIAQCAELEDETSNQRILYVTSSAQLVKNMKEMRDRTPRSEQAKKVAVEYKTYAELVQEIALSESACDLLNGRERTEFSAWCDDYYLKRNPGLKDQLQNGLMGNGDLNTSIYQEFRMMSGHTEDEYTTFSQRERLFNIEITHASSAAAGSSPNTHNMYGELYQALNRYRAYLKQNSKIDMALFEFESKAVYSRVFVDEAQDFSSLQLRQLAALANALQIAYFIDSNQSLNDNFSKWPCLRRILGSDHREIELPYTFRCSKSVIALANATLGLKLQLTGGVLEKGAATEVQSCEQAPEGAVTWLDELSDEDKHALNNSVGAAIICHEKDVDILQQEIPKALVLTVAQAKGLEYKQIVIYHLLERSLDKKFNQLAKEYRPNDKAFGRAKGDKAHHEYGPAFNQLFTAFTRARENLWVIHKKETHDFVHVLKALKETSAIAMAKAPLSALLKKSTQAELCDEISKQLNAGNNDVAWNIYKHHISNNEQHFKRDFSEELSDSSQTPALQTATSSASSSSSSSLAQAQPSSNQECKTDTASSAAIPSNKKTKTPPPKKATSSATTPKDSASSSALAKENREKLAKALYQDTEEDLPFDIRKNMTEDALRQCLRSKDRVGFFLKEPINGIQPQKSLAAWIKCYPDLEEVLLEFLNGNVFENLTLYENGQSFLLFLLQGYEVLAKKINAQALYTQVISNERISTLYALSERKTGLKILEILFKKQAELIKKISTIDLCHAIPAERGSYGNTSAIYWLASDPQGREILANLLRQNPALTQSISAVDLCRARTAAARDAQGESIYSNLLNSEDGQLILAQIYTKRPALKAELETIYRSQFASSSNLSSFGIFSSASSSNHDETQAMAQNNSPQQEASAKQ